MEDFNKILYGSVLKNVKKAKASGKLDTKMITVFKMLNYFKNDISFIEEVYAEESSKIIRSIDTCLHRLKLNHSQEFCILSEVPISEDNNIYNIAPIISDYTLTNTSQSTNLPLKFFLEGFNDPNNDSWSKLHIDPSTVENIIKLNGMPITDYTIIDIEGMSINSDIGLTYEYVNNEIDDEFIHFFIEDDNVNPLKSNQGTLFFINDFIKNHPPEIGNIRMVVDNGVTTILDLNVFRNMMNPSYSDPEGDDIDAIRIDYVDPSNTGDFLYNGISIYEGLIIPAQALADNRFIHVGPTQEDINTDFFRFSIRDVGSLIWVS